MSSQQAYQKKMFFIAAVFNWVAAILFVGLYYLSQEHLAMLIKIPEQTLWFFFSWTIVFVFGGGYYLVSRDIERNRDIIKMGLIGKVIFFSMVFYYWQKGDVGTVAFCLVIGDAIFSVLFAQVLYSLKDRTQMCLSESQ
jgi:hypothetical protein